MSAQVPGPRCAFVVLQVGPRPDPIYGGRTLEIECTEQTLEVEYVQYDTIVVTSRGEPMVAPTQ